MAVTINGQCYRADKWGFGGFLLNANPADMPLGTLISIEGVGPNKKKPAPVSIRARVVRAGDDGACVALNFLHLDEDAFRVLGELSV